MFKEQWDKPEYKAANSAENEPDLTQDEKDVFYYLNLARINPRLFAETYVTHFNGKKNIKNDPSFEERKQSLIHELLNLRSLDILFPNKTIIEHAECFAIQGGALGIIGHKRDGTDCKMDFAECCAYSNTDGLYIVLDLLIDPGEKNANLGHRKICLSNYGMLGVSIKPHLTTQYIAVLQFGYNPDIEYKDGNYTGHLSLNGKKEGKGIYDFGNNSKYDGDWRDNKMHGTGVYIYSNGDKYVGEWKNGKKDGHGNYFYINGDRYKGEWKNGKRNGYGIYIYLNGANYKGGWMNGKRNGHGIHTYSNGAIYDGGWQEDKMHGSGVYTSSKGIVSQENWKNGVRQE